VFLLFFAELASANLKRLAPVLEAWDHSKRPVPAGTRDGNPFPWKGGWEKLAALVWALGVSIPLLAFALACRLFLEDRAQAANLILGSTVGSNVLGLTLAFGAVLISGPVTFFRVRSMTSPVFLLLATVAFTYTCLNLRVAPGEGFLLLLLLLAYGIYFRRFSSEWKNYERAFPQASLVESSEGILPILAVLCMGIGFFLLAILVAYPFVQALGAWSTDHGGGADSFRLGAHLAAFVLASPWLLRCLMAARAGSTAKAATLSSISHACLLNVLLIPAFAAFLGAGGLTSSMLALHLPALLVLTGVFVSALLIEKEQGGMLSWILFGLYLVYTVLGMKF
jgi:Ca2+/Na+ antiporter